MSIIWQIYWITVVAGAATQMLRIKWKKDIDPFQLMKDMQDDLDSMSEKMREKLTIFIDWMTDYYPVSLYMFTATLSLIPIINLMYLYTNVKGIMSDSKKEEM